MSAAPVAPATAAGRAHAGDQPTPLLHVCRNHPRSRDGDCGPTCVAFCGAVYATPGRVVRKSRPTSDVCVVCWAMANGSLW